MHIPVTGGNVPAPAPADIICVIDDDASVRKSVGRLLQSAGLEVRVFSEAEVFLDFLASTPVPVVILDVWMAGMSGMELLVHLCARSPWTRAIFITGHDDRAAQVTVMAAGAFGFLIKPFDDEELLIAVNRALSIPRQGPTGPGARPPRS
ncbi:MAG: response regulator transcription factor [Chthoniobacterales bacterium]